MATHQALEVRCVRGGARGAAAEPAADRVAVEEPLEVRLNGQPFAVIMRTPGADQALAAGFLLSERVIASADDLGTIEHCTLEDGPAANVINVTLAGAASAALDRVLAQRRNVVANASCGLCGRVTIDRVTEGLTPIDGSLRVDSDLLASLPDRLRMAQPGFDATGGLHAAALFDTEGAIAGVAEDVGRHNAVDKVIGAMLLREALPLRAHLLCVSGRTSFEIILKAFVAGVPVVAAVSAPSSLAIDLARTAGITLAGFVRGGGFNIYTGVGRVVLAA